MKISPANSSPLVTVSVPDTASSRIQNFRQKFSFFATKSTFRTGSKEKLHEKPAFLKGMLWFTFSGTAMLSAFILPIHIIAMSSGFSMKLESPLFRIYFFVLFFAALYHGLYRVKTIWFDLGFGKYQKIIDVIAAVLLIIFMSMSIHLLF